MPTELGRTNGKRQTSPETHRDLLGRACQLNDCKSEISCLYQLILPPAQRSAVKWRPSAFIDVCLLFGLSRPSPRSLSSLEIRLLPLPFQAALLSRRANERDEFQAKKKLKANICSGLSCPLFYLLLLLCFKQFETTTTTSSFLSFSLSSSFNLIFAINLKDRLASRANGPFNF